MQCFHLFCESLIRVRSRGIVPGLLLFLFPVYKCQNDAMHSSSYPPLCFSPVLRAQKSIRELNADAGGCAIPPWSNGTVVPEKDRGQRPVSPTVCAIVTSSANNSNINY